MNDKYELAKKEIGSGNYQIGIDLLNSIEVHTRYSYYELAKAHFSLEQYDNALMFINEVIKIKFDWAGAYNIRGMVRIKQNNLLDAIKDFILIVDSWPYDDQDNINKYYSYVFDNLHLNLGNTEEFEYTTRILSAYLCLKFPSQPIGYFQQGISEWNQSKSGNSLSLKKINISNIALLERHSTGCLTIGDSIPDILRDTAKYAVQMVSCDSLPDNLPECSHVYLTSCDSNYFIRFIDLLVRSFQNCSINSILIVSVINPSDVVLAMIENLKDDLHHKIIFHISNIDPEYTNKVYYASHRFFVAEAVLKKYNLPLVVIDTDAVFKGDLSLKDIIELMRYDLSVKKGIQTKLSYYPWRQFAAGFTFFSGSAASYSISLNITKLLSFYFEKYGCVDCIWYVDQSVLASIYKYYELSNEHRLGYMGRTSGVIVFPDGSRETKDEFVKSFMN